MKQHIYIELYRKAFITLTELIEASLTTSLDQDTSAPVAKDEDCRQMVSKGRVLPLICKREKYSYYIGKYRKYGNNIWETEKKKCPQGKRANKEGKQKDKLLHPLQKELFLYALFMFTNQRNGPWPQVSQNLVPT